MARVLLLCGYLSVQIVLCLSYGYSTTYPMDYRQSNRGSSTDLDKLNSIYAKLVTRMKEVREDYTDLQRNQLNEGLKMCSNKLMEGMQSSSSSHEDLSGALKLCVVKEILQFLHLNNVDLGVSAEELEFLKLDNMIEHFADKYRIDATTEDTTEEYIHTTISPMSTIGNSGNIDIDISFKNAGNCLSSPGYPNNYPDNSHKIQRFSVAAGQDIEITFQDFELEEPGAVTVNYGSSTNATICKFDYLQFRDGNGNIVSPKLCGDLLPAKITIQTPTAEAIFHSDGSVNRKGFKFCYTSGCNSTEFACADGLQCIRGSYRCDGGPPDCRDGSDEAHCSREQEDLSLGQYFLEAVNWMKKKDTPWRYFLPENTDIDQDGNLSDLEIQHKFNTYVGEVFILFDQDKDNSITEEEFRSLKLDIPQLTKAVDIALENFPLRPFFLATEALLPNEDDIYDENDFLRPFFPDTEATTEGRSGLSQGLMDLLYWEHTRVIWDKGGRFLLIADANGDGKLTLEELATKGKELMTKILKFLDQNQDGKISLEDINLHLTVGPIQSLASELFEDVTAGKGEIDLYNLEIAGQNMNKYFYRGVNPLTEFDNNRDGKLNAADAFYHSQNRHYRSQPEESFLLPMLSEKLDKNQDGKIQREELRQFIDEMFNQLDIDDDGALTLEDVYSLLRENGLNCLQVGALRSFTRVFLDKIDAVTRDFFSYIFHQFDIDGNGQISTTELEQMRVPCESGVYRGRDYGYRGPSSGYGRDYGYRGPSSGYGRDYGYRGPSSGYGRDYGYRGPSSGYGGDYGTRGTTPRYRRNYGNRVTTPRYRRNYGNRGTIPEYDRNYEAHGTDLSEPRPAMAADPYTRRTCFVMYQTYFGTKILDLIRSFPEFVFSERYGRGPGGHGGGREEPKKENLLDKLAKHACEILT